MYQLIAFDMDGTLLTSEQKLAPSSLEAIAKASEQGKQVVLSTGRPVSELKDYLPDLPQVRYGVLASGALVYDFVQQKVLHKKAIAEEVVSQLIHLITTRDIMLIVMLDGKGYLSKASLERLSEFHLAQFDKLYRETAIFVDDMAEFLASHLGEFEKINLYHTTPEGRTESTEVLSSYDVALANTDKTGLEVTALGGDKGTGLAFLCKYLSLEMSQVIAVGDADNDTSMIVSAGLGLAMGNANERIKSLAKAVLSDNNHGGCAEAIEQYLLG